MAEAGARIFLSPESKISSEHMNPNESILNTNLISNYKEQLNSSPYIKIGMTFIPVKNTAISVNKTWSTLTNKISYTFMNQYNKTINNKEAYEPISISISYSF